jgi:hypothetical protein
MLGMGRAQARIIKRDPVDWANLQMRVLVADRSNLIPFWTKCSCDKQLHEPLEDQDEFIHWRNWRAPKWFFMQPFTAPPYHRDTAWERMSEADSERVLLIVEDRFNHKLITALDNDVDRARIDLALTSPNLARRRRASLPIRTSITDVQSSRGTRMLAPSVSVIYGIGTVSP